MLFGEGCYADIVEREIYNGALSGISLSGDRFFYENPLASQGGHHRVEWYETSCCPTNLVRFLPSIGNYMYAVTPDGIVANQYASGEAALELTGGGKIRLKQTTNYPWEGSIAFDVQPLQESAAFALRLRVPGWCKSYSVTINGQIAGPELARLEKGYLVIDRAWGAGDRIVLHLDMPVEKVRAREEVEADRGRVALQRGPVVFCLEQTDNPGVAYDACVLPRCAAFAVVHRSELLGGVTVLSGCGEDGQEYRLVPYYAWDNREPGYMQVWLREVADQRLYWA
ncbi:glycoside hydrolase family 127 protein [Paenibacillaceae bacterium]|nr:glycoside hydrolase family 127 protein [Paenibacillaceae bacterium]